MSQPPQSEPRWTIGSYGAIARSAICRSNTRRRAAVLIFAGLRRRCSLGTWRAYASAVEKATHRGAFGLIAHDQPRAVGAARVQHARLRRAGDRQRAEEPEKRRSAHVGLQRLGRVPRDERQADERARRGQARLHRAEDLLLAPGARAVALALVAGFLARRGERERLLAVEVRRAAAQARGVAAVLEAAVDLRDDAAAGVV